MKEENEINEEVKELLDSLEQHGQNARRQKELCDLIDSLEAGTSTSLRAKRRRLYPIWWIVGAAAACLLLWLLAKPTMKEIPEMNEEILVEEIGVEDTIQEEYETIEEAVFHEEPIVTEKILAEETPVKPTIQKQKAPKPTSKNIEKQFLAENTIIETTKQEPTDTANCQLPTQNSPQRRVIRSLNLVCYECQKEPENNSQLPTPNSQLEKTIFGQPQDPNMKNGSLAFEVKLY